MSFVKVTKSLQKVIEPKTYEKTLSGPYAKEWQQAMKEKYDSQIEQGTFVITTLSYNYMIIPRKWVYRVKEKQTDLLKDSRLDGLLKNSCKKRAKIIKTPTYLRYDQIHLGYYSGFLPA